MEEHNEKQCLFCKRDSAQVPLVQLEFKEKNTGYAPNIFLC